MESQCANLISNLLPALQGQATSQCLNELQNIIAQNIPSALTPEQLYPQHLKLCLIIKLQLEGLILQAANLSNQLKKAPSAELQQQLSQCQNQAQQLQQQFNNQKSICITLKLCILL